MKRVATAVDASAALTYHSFPMSPPFPRPLRVLPFVPRVLRLVPLLLAFLAAAPAGCATSDDASKPVTYSLTAKQNYEKGMAELKDEEYAEAQKYFQFVKQKYPFSKYAVLAELALADSQFARGNYNEAIDSYKTFARLHPTHDKVEDGYVAFRIGESYFKDMPDDIFLLPPSYEKDQSAVMDALRELADFSRKFPDSKYLKPAGQLRQKVLQRLVDHEVYVARFYLRSDHPNAAALRLEGALRRYPGSGREPELLYALGETYLKMNDPLRAKETFQRVVSEYAAADDARRASLYLQFIMKRYGDDPKALVPAAEPASAARAAHG
jgi:outer membrane protein assembly factor BamD